MSEYNPFVVSIPKRSWVHSSALNLTSKFDIFTSQQTHKYTNILTTHQQIVHICFKTIYNHNHCLKSYKTLLVSKRCNVYVKLGCSEARSRLTPRLGVDACAVRRPRLFISVACFTSAIH